MPKDLNSLTVPLGFTAAGGAYGIKQSGLPDLALIASDAPCAAAAVTTTNLVCSEATLVARKHLAGGRLRAIVCNSGNSNSSTGPRGLKDARAMCATVARYLKCPVEQVIACSTGIIGRFLPMEKIQPGIADLLPRLARGPAADELAARGIMTTDLVPKAALRSVKIGGKTVHLAGICKGSGMISPKMATMLAFLTTDADISAPLLKKALVQAVNGPGSFNRISVDQHTSPSDTVAIMASGKAGHKPIRSAASADFGKFTAALAALCADLSYQIVADGEGVTRVIRIRISGAASDGDALRVARSIADSPLVKTAVHGGDPNWGRIVTAAGYSGAKINPRKISLWLGKVKVYRNGQPAAYELADAEAAVRTPEVLFKLSLGLGKGTCEFLTCDLSRKYIEINADYHT